MELFEQKTGAKTVEGYGLSETSPVTHFNPILGNRKPGSIGLPLPSTEAKIVDVEYGIRDMQDGEHGETIDRKELIDFCRKKMANYKVPRDIEFRESLPKSAVGKVLRRLLRDETRA